jgi:hypothetical protein
MGKQQRKKREQKGNVERGGERELGRTEEEKTKFKISLHKELTEGSFPLKSRNPNVYANCLLFN